MWASLDIRSYGRVWDKGTRRPRVACLGHAPRRQSRSPATLLRSNGTATIQGDAAETNATYDIFKRAVPVSSLKSYTGHTLGACGAVEAVLTVDMAHKKWFSPTINLNNVDDECGKLDYITGQGREIDTSVVMSNNFAFGGINTSLIFKLGV